MDINSITSTLKDYLRELPDHLLTGELHHAFLKAAAAEDIAGLTECVGFLPEVHYETLEMVISLLVEVTALADTNKMKASNLGVVFGPTLMAAPVYVDTPYGCAPCGCAPQRTRLVCHST